MSKNNLSLLDRFYQYIANNILPNRLLWFCLFRNLSIYQSLPDSNKLTSQLMVWELIHRLDKNNWKNENG